VVPRALTPQVWARLVVLLSATAVLQVGILDGIVIGGAHPDAFLTLAIVSGLVAGPQRGALIAFVAGLVADLFVITPFGLTSLCFVLVAFTAGSASALSGGRAPYSFKVVTAAIGGLAATLLYSLVASLIGQPDLARHQLVVVAVVVAAGCAALVLPFGAAMSWAIGGGTGAERRLAAASGGSATRWTRWTPTAASGGRGHR
jgi:rod shape-determining protein MreD